MTVQPTARADVAPEKRRGRRLSHNLNGQRLGRKGHDTRERIIAATVEFIAENDDAPVSLSAVARRASLGLTSIYSYFADLPELLFAVLEPVMADAEASYLKLVGEIWPDDELGERSQAFVYAFFAFWQRNSRILHLRNSLADQMDVRMMEHRIRSSQPVIRNFIRLMEHDPREVKTAAAGMATVLYIGLERTVAVVTDVTMPKVLPGRFAPDIAHFLEAEGRLLEMGIREHREAARQS